MFPEMCSFFPMQMSDYFIKGDLPPSKSQNTSKTFNLHGRFCALEGSQKVPSIRCPPYPSNLVKRAYFDVNLSTLKVLFHVI